MRGKTILVLALVAIIVFPSVVSLVSARSTADITSRRIICTVYGGDGKVKILSKVLTAFQIEKLKNLLNELRQSKGESDFENKLMKLDHLLREYGFLSGEMSLKMILEEREKLLNQRWGDFKRNMLRRYFLLSGVLRKIFGEIEKEANIKDSYTLKEVVEISSTEVSTTDTTSSREHGDPFIFNVLCTFKYGGISGFSIPYFLLPLPIRIPIVDPFGPFAPILVGTVADYAGTGLTHSKDVVFSTRGICGYKEIWGTGGGAALFVLIGVIGVGINIPSFHFFAGFALVAMAWDRLQ